MRTLLRPLVAATLLAAAPALAQEAKAPMLGVGVSMNTNALLGFLGAGAPITQLHVPISLGALRIEPSFGFLTQTDDADDETDTYSSIGVGAFFVRQVHPQVLTTFGARVAAGFSTTENRSGPTLFTSKQTTLSLAAAVGGEYLPAPWISFGAEAQLGFASIGDEETEGGGSTTTVEGGSAAITSGLVFVRFYFF